MDTLIVVDERHDYIPQVVAGHYLRMAGCSVVNMAEDCIGGGCAIEFETPGLVDCIGYPPDVYTGEGGG